MHDTVENRTPGAVIPAPEGIEVRFIPGKGRGVFATRDFRKGERIERCPVIPVPPEQWEFIEETVLEDYVYDWGEDEDGDECAVILGLGSLYNHSYEPNAENLVREDLLAMDFVAVRPIAAGGEITVNYNADDDPLDEMWFEVED